jgi:hypothetical protein
MYIFSKYTKSVPPKKVISLVFTNVSEVLPHTATICQEEISLWQQGLQIQIPWGP